MKQENVLVTVRENGTLDIATINDEPSLTQQQYAEECDINNIVKRYANDPATWRMLTEGKKGVYADFSEIKDYQQMLNQVIHAQEAFMTLPASIRARFRNDPGSLLEFLQDPNNREEAVELGLIDKNNAQLAKPVIRDDSNDATPGKAQTAKKPSMSTKKAQPEVSEANE